VDASYAAPARRLIRGRHANENRFYRLLSQAEHRAESAWRFNRQKLADYELPKIITFMPALPRNAAGKVLQELRSGGRCDERS
jgi:acyl-CoA synthetase (AMP-forming)/AMP-acid ligase II